MDSLKDKITKASESTNARFKRKKIRSMKRGFDKINEKLKEPEAKLESVEPWGPRLLEGAFSSAYRRYRIDGMLGKMDPDTFFNRIRRFLIELLKKESRTGAVRAQSTTWIRFRKDDKLVELVFNR